MIWAGISHDGLIDLAFPQGKQKAADYIKVLENNLLPFAERKYGANYVFQQDNSNPYFQTDKDLFPREKHKHFGLASSFS